MFVYFKIVNSTCLTHKPVPYQNFLSPSFSFYYCPFSAIPFSLDPPLLRSAFKAQSIFSCTSLRKLIYVQEAFADYNSARALTLAKKRFVT